MKYIFTSIGLGLALAFTASAQDRHQGDNEARPASVHRSAPTAPAVAPATPQRVITNTQPTQRYISNAPFRQRTYTTTPSVHPNAPVRSNTTANARVRERNFRATATEQARVRGNATVNRERNVGMNRNVAVRDRANATVTNNWRGSQFGGRQYAVFRDYHRTWHDRAWWTSHFDRVIFVSGGWWYWDAGYWFPAWGYDPYAYYPYDGPIYGYANLTPEQIVAEVQGQLQADGYYAGPIDGVLGAMTRQAIAAFQADHGLAITSTVDEPTIATLGIS